MYSLFFVEARGAEACHPSEAKAERQRDKTQKHNAHTETDKEEGKICNTCVQGYSYSFMRATSTKQETLATVHYHTKTQRHQTERWQQGAVADRVSLVTSADISYVHTPKPAHGNAIINPGRCFTSQEDNHHSAEQRQLLRKCCVPARSMTFICPKQSLLLQYIRQIRTPSKDCVSPSPDPVGGELVDVDGSAEGVGQRDDLRPAPPNARLPHHLVRKPHRKGHECK